MRRIAHALAVLLIATAPAAGQSGGAPGEKSAEEGLSLLEEGARIILRSMIGDVEPALKDLHAEMGRALAEMEPAFRDLAAMIGDMRNYHAPEMLPNGDIIIRRKSPAERALPEPDGEIEI
ncbi:AAA+ family ATPase [Defluviimonas sp. WL0024]|uniref:AAA+ family ATPase n=1 Tax=Albidovulum salinarum TaxID=2984153 RepID=A0ABT2WZE8_9RHOB|nr:AAA+ family ATPase [Defluviimonas sp. WL0024]MCU9847052.1 AAA+ family ATPase [Defluviimonas sp. WL0024]